MAPEFVVEDSVGEDELHETEVFGGDGAEEVCVLALQHTQHRLPVLLLVHMQFEYKLYKYIIVKYMNIYFISIHIYIFRVVTQGMLKHINVKKYKC